MTDTLKPLSDRDAQTLERMAKAFADWDKPVDHVERFAGKGFANMKPGPRKFPGYAHFPGTGPAGETCYGCRFLGGDRKGPTCVKFQQLTSRPGGKISASSPACRYFQVNRKKSQWKAESGA